MAGDSREQDRGKRLLVLGAGPAQRGLLAAARARELHVIAVDRDPSAPGFRYADRRAILSTEDEPGIERLAAAERAAEAVRKTWRSLEEFNVNASLALEALFITLRHELAGAPSPV